SLLLRVTGVFSELPNQSSIQFEMIAPMNLTKEVFGPWIEDVNKTWYYPQVYSFVKLVTAESITKVESQLASFEGAFLPPYITDVRTQGLLPLEEVHFSNLENEIHPTIKKNILYTFTAAGVVILLIAAFNFINLFLSRIVLRIKDVSVQKVMGASGYNIWQQTFVESLVYLGSSLFLALGWVFLFLPVFNNLMETDLGLFKPNTLEAWLTVFLIILALSLMISFVPSLFLSRFSLTSSLKGLKQSTKKRKSAFSLQSTLVVFQFSIAVVLIISTIVMQSQMSFIKSKNLGLNTEQVVVLPVRDESVQNNFSTLKNQLLQNNTITSVSAISNFPWSKGYYDFQTLITHSGNEIKANAYTLLVDEDFVQTMGMNMVFGRSFSREFGTDSTAFIMNETAARLYEIDDQEAVTIEMAQIGSRQPKKGQLIGIVEDFHLQSLHNKVEPLIITLAPESYFTDNIIVKFSSLDVTNTLNSIASDLQKIAPDRPFEYFFLDEAFAQLYQKETRISFLFNYFSILAIVIACLGLLGMVAFATSQRIKEIGIRKVLGATVSSIVKLITMSFIKLVIIAVLIAVPVAYLFMSNWLESFSYRTTLSWWMFLAAGCIALIIALIAIGYQSLRSAIANPVNALRSE
ncbi:MAG: FtsX-like permease family protein, partial [Bacteroidota bacterium]